MDTVYQILMLAISATTLVYLIKYVRATNKIAQQSIRQVEATFRPAVVCIPGHSVENVPRLRNIGKGPAIDVHWFLDEKHQDKIPYLEPGNEAFLLRSFEGMKPFFETIAPLVIQYKSISGAAYKSTCTYDVNRGDFAAVFSD
jgi:hypothetical protein